MSDELDATAEVYKCYSDNINPLTPFISDTLGDFIDEYTAEWVVDAIKVACLQNKRSLKYILGILKRWESDGKSDPLETQTPNKRYITGKYSDYVKH